MTAEETLREVLRREAATIVPTGDGLDRIRARLVRRRRRMLLLPGVALATAAATASLFLLGDHAGTQKVVQAPLHPSPTPTPTDPVAPPPPDPGFTPALWPFSSAAQVAAWRRDPGAMPWAGSNLEVARHFVTDYLKLSGVRVTQGCVSCDVVGVETLAGRTVGEISLVREDGGRRAFSVYGVTATDLTVTSPRAGAAVGSPTQVTGRITGVDENVRLRLLTAAGAEVAAGAAPAGSALPWQGTLSWSDPSWSVAGIVATTYSPKDGSLNRLVVVPVTRAPHQP